MPDVWQQNPDMMHDLAAHAAASLRQKWATPEHKQKVMRQRVARYGSQVISLLGRDGFTPESYEENRRENWVPKLQTALGYFTEF